MKSSLLFAAVLGFIMVTQTGCFSSADNGGAASQVNSNTETATENNPTPSNNEKQPAENDKSASSANIAASVNDAAVSLDNVTEWIDLYEDSEDSAKSAVYDEALALIQKTSSMSGKLLKSSKHFGYWYLIQLKVSDNAENELDAPQRYNTAFLVDMSKKSIPSRGDFVSTAPLLTRLFTLGHQNSTDGSGEFIRTLSSVISSIEFNHAGYVESSEADGFHVPQLTKDDAGNSRLEYFLSDGISEAMTRCSLTMQDGTFVFEHKSM